MLWPLRVIGYNQLNGRGGVPAHEQGPQPFTNENTTQCDILIFIKFAPIISSKIQKMILWFLCHFAISIFIELKAINAVVSHNHLGRGGVHWIYYLRVEGLWIMFVCFAYHITLKKRETGRRLLILYTDMDFHAKIANTPKTNPILELPIFWN